MNFLPYALFLFPFVASAVQSTQDEGGPSPLNPAELQFALVGLTAMSRSLWLETHYGTKQTAEEITKVGIGQTQKELGCGSDLTPFTYNRSYPSYTPFL